ncbi:MAG: hypothetical protein ACK4UK_00690 [Flavobacterium sp.]
MNFRNFLTVTFALSSAIALADGNNPPPPPGPTPPGFPIDFWVPFFMILGIALIFIVIHQKNIKKTS